MELLKIESLNGCKEKNTEALNHVLALAQKMGMKTRKSSKDNVGIVEIGSGKEIIGVLVHVDVVGVGDIQKWNHPPFEGKVCFR